VSLFVPFTPPDEPIPLKVALRQEDRAVILLNCPNKTRITYAEMARYPNFFTYEGGTIAVNATNGCLIYAASPNAARGWYDCELLMSDEDITGQEAL
jgi:hypothetical protein